MSKPFLLPLFGLDFHRGRLGGRVGVRHSRTSFHLNNCSYVYYTHLFVPVNTFPAKSPPAGCLFSSGSGIMMLLTIAAEMETAQERAGVKRKTGGSFWMTPIQALRRQPRRGKIPGSAPPLRNRKPRQRFSVFLLFHFRIRISNHELFL